MLWRTGRHEFRFPRPTLVMGVLNVTPDSFSDGGKYNDHDRAFARALELEEHDRLICGLIDRRGDRWRHLAPKGRASMRWEWMNLAILIFAAVVTAAMLLKYALAWLRAPALFGR